MINEFYKKIGLVFLAFFILSVFSGLVFWQMFFMTPFLFVFIWVYSEENAKDEEKIWEKIFRIKLVREKDPISYGLIQRAYSEEEVFWHRLKRDMLMIFILSFVSMIIIFFTFEMISRFQQGMVFHQVF